jgi:hypothetical protein
MEDFLQIKNYERLNEQKSEITIKIRFVDPVSIARILTVFRIRIHRLHMFLGLLDPDPLVKGMDPDPLVKGMDPDPSILISFIKQK